MNSSSNVSLRPNWEMVVMEGYWDGQDIVFGGKIDILNVMVE